LFTFCRNLIILAIMATIGAVSASATIAVEVFTFTGQCTDCTGTGTGRLILIPDLSIDNDPNETISGILPVGLGPANISISGRNGSFNTNSDGTWSAFDPPAGEGTKGIWSAVRDSDS